MVFARRASSTVRELWRCISDICTLHNVRFWHLADIWGLSASASYSSPFLCLADADQRKISAVLAEGAISTSVGGRSIRAASRRCSKGDGCLKTARSNLYVASARLSSSTGSDCSGATNTAQRVLTLILRHGQTQRPP